MSSDAIESLVSKTYGTDLVYLLVAEEGRGKREKEGEKGTHLLHIDVASKHVIHPFFACSRGPTSENSGGKKGGEKGGGGERT